MPLTLTWSDILLRLGLAFVAGFLLGLNRGEKGHVAGLRTLLLVCLAAAIAMIQVNLLLGAAGKRSDSFVILDLMRLPLGILSGMGFIGAGAILRRGSMIIGVTTAASLWFATVIGLCFGGGQLGLGAVSAALGLAILWGLKFLEELLPQERCGRLALFTNSEELGEAAIRRVLEPARARLIACGFTQERSGNAREFDCLVGWKASGRDDVIPPFVGAFASHSAVKKVAWEPEGIADRARDSS